MEARLRSFIAIPLLLATASAEETESRCQVAGGVFGIDPLGDTMLLKDSNGYFKTINLSSGTTFLKLPIAAGASVSKITVKDVSTGDLVCVQTGDANAATRISVVSRADVHRAQSAFLAEWQRNSVYGTIASIDVPGRTVVVKSLAPSAAKEPVRVSLPATVRLRTASPEARRITDATSFQLQELHVGDQVYARGKRDGDGALTAALVLKDGYRAILGTLLEVRALDSTVQIQEFGTGRPLRMKITPGEVYRTTENLTNPMRVETQSGVVLTPVGFADLTTGDAIMIVGKAGAGSPEGEGVVAVTRFGTFGVLPQDQKDRITWLLAK